MTTDPFTTWTAAAVADGVRTGDLTARGATEEALRRIGERDDTLHAFVLVRADRALAEADAVDARVASGEHLPLAGVPVAIKDNVPVAGEPMRVGSVATDPSPQPADHPVVSRLRAAGAVVVGITTVPELCVFGATDTRWGVTRNPWLASRTPGGSSGGSAAAVASGMVPVAHAADGMGSIRIPAAACGLVGIKPGSGVVPAELGVSSWFGMAENGPLATTVADAALMLSVMAGDPSLAVPIEPGKRLVIAVSDRSPVLGVRVSPAARRATAAVATALAKAGHEVVRADPPYPTSTAIAALARWFAGTAEEAELPDAAQLEPRVRTHAAIRRAARRLGLVKDGAALAWQQQSQQWLSSYDFLLTPALAAAPIAARAWHDGSWVATMTANVRYAPFAAPWNLAGVPAMVVPAGIDDSLGMPVAVQLVAAPGSEARLLGAAALVERLLPWARTAPAYA